MNGANYPMPQSHYFDSPLVNKYFGVYIKALIDAHSIVQYSGRFFLVAENSAIFEQRLARIEKWGQTGQITKEIGGLQKLGSLMQAFSSQDKDAARRLSKFCEELDRRLMDAWAELRVIDLVALEGFENIEKVTESADLVATCKNTKFAFQVKRIKNSLSMQLEKQNSLGGQRNSSPYGTVDDIHNRLAGPVSHFFWEALLEKNGKYKNYSLADHRCIVIVSADGDLQDRFIRHIACQQICTGTQDPAFGELNFESLLWLPDTSLGAWIFFDGKRENIRCYADWQDNPESVPQDKTKINRREIDLINQMPAWVSDEVFSHTCY